MCYHNTNGFVADDVIMLLQTARLKKIHNTLIFATINIINALLAMHALLDWQIGNVGIIDGLLGKLCDWNMWCSCYRKAWSFNYSNNSNTHKKWFGYLCNKFATPGGPLVTKIQNFPSWWITRNTVVAVLQIVGSKNKAGHTPNWGSPRIFMQIED